MSAQEALETSRRELRQLAICREKEREQEYQRLAREFHDELGQLLTSARMQLQRLDGRLAADPALSPALGPGIGRLFSPGDVGVRLQVPRRQTLASHGC